MGQEDKNDFLRVSHPKKQSGELFFAQKLFPVVLSYYSTANSPDAGFRKNARKYSITLVLKASFILAFSPEKDFFTN